MFFLFGTRTSDDAMSEGEFHCEECQATTAYTLHRVRRYFHVFFVPLIPIGQIGEDYVECDRCKSTYKTTVLPAQLPEARVVKGSATSDDPDSDDARLDRELDRFNH